MRPQYGAIIIGGDHNGLICAAYLARAGKDPPVLERRVLIGGPCAMEEVWPGFYVSTTSCVIVTRQSSSDRLDRLANLREMERRGELAAIPWDEGPSQHGVSPRQ